MKQRYIITLISVLVLSDTNVCSLKLAGWHILRFPPSWLFIHLINVMESVIIQYIRNKFGVNI